VQNIIVGRYSELESAGYQGWLEPDDKTWIMYVANDGTPTVFLNRNPDTGEVL